MTPEERTVLVMQIADGLRNRAVEYYRMARKHPNNQAHFLQMAADFEEASEHVRKMDVDYAMRRARFVLQVGAWLKMPIRDRLKSRVPRWEDS